LNYIIRYQGNILTKLVQINAYADDVIIIGWILKELEETLQKLDNTAHDFTLFDNAHNVAHDNAHNVAHDFTLFCRPNFLPRNIKY
jgi:hypothetical protein